MDALSSVSNWVIFTKRWFFYQDCNPAGIDLENLLKPFSSDRPKILEEETFNMISHWCGINGSIVYLWIISYDKCVLNCRFFLIAWTSCSYQLLRNMDYLLFEIIQFELKFRHYATEIKVAIKLGIIKMLGVIQRLHGTGLQIMFSNDIKARWKIIHHDQNIGLIAFGL